MVNMLLTITLFFSSVLVQTIVAAPLPDNVLSSKAPVPSLVTVQDARINIIVSKVVAQLRSAGATIPTRPHPTGVLHLAPGLPIPVPTFQPIALVGSAKPSKRECEVDSGDSECHIQPEGRISRASDVGSKSRRGRTDSNNEILEPRRFVPGGGPGGALDPVGALRRFQHRTSTITSGPQPTTSVNLGHLPVVNPPRSDPTRSLVIPTPFPIHKPILITRPLPLPTSDVPNPRPIDNAPPPDFDIPHITPFKLSQDPGPQFVAAPVINGHLTIITGH